MTTNLSDREIDAAVPVHEHFSDCVLCADFKILIMGLDEVAMAECYKCRSGDRREKRSDGHYYHYASDGLPGYCSTSRAWVKRDEIIAALKVVEEHGK